MSNLIQNCGVLATTNTTNACGEVPAGFPEYVVFGLVSTPITAVGDIPTAAEVQTYLTAGSGLIFPVANGKVIPPVLQTKTGADTYDHQDKVVSENNGISFTVKKVTNKMLEMFAQNNLNNDRLRLFWIDDKKQWHGGKDGYIVSSYIPNYEHAGWSDEAMINKTASWVRDPETFDNASDPDTDYSTLTNAVQYAFTETMITTYTLGDVTNYQDITGWTKATYPALWFVDNTGTVNIYGDSGHTTLLAHFTAGIGVIAITADGGSDFAGTVTGVNALTSLDEWKVEATEL